jgi:signal transduction histidine kinase
VTLFPGANDEMPLHALSGLNRYNRDQVIIALILAMIVLFSIIATVALYSLQTQRQAQEAKDVSTELDRALSERTFYVSQLVAQHLVAIEKMVESLSKLPQIQNGDYAGAKSFIDLTTESWSDDIDGLFILDRDALLTYTSSNNTSLLGTAFPSHVTYTLTKEQKGTIVSPLTESLNGSLRIYVASPIVDTYTGQFRGTVAASILADTFARSIEKQLEASTVQDTAQTFVLIDPAGHIIYIPSSAAIVGKNILSEEILAEIPPTIKDGLVTSINAGLAGQAGIYQLDAPAIRALKSTATTEGGKPIDFVQISYSPVKVSDRLVMVTFLVESANLGILANASSQTEFLFVFIYLVLASMTTFGVAIILINRKLNRRLEAKTTELQESNTKLQISTAENQEKAKKLQEVDTQKGEFSAMITHELKTPLVPIIGYGNMLLTGRLGKLNDPQMQKIQIMYSNAERLTALIQDILDVQKLELGKLHLDQTQAFPRKMIEESISSLRPSAEAREIELSSRIDMDKEIRCDQDRIVQVLNNLISNAIKFSPNKSKIIVSCAVDADNVIFSVRDSGSGIPKEKQGEIFTKFYQVDTRLARKAGGTGLGLVICKGIVEAHGGKIWFESEEGKGSLFSFSLSLN